MAVNLNFSQARIEIDCLAQKVSDPNYTPSTEDVRTSELLYSRAQEFLFRREMDFLEDLWSNIDNPTPRETLNTYPNLVMEMQKNYNSLTPEQKKNTEILLKLQAECSQLRANGYEALYKAKEAKDLSPKDQATITASLKAVDSVFEELEELVSAASKHDQRHSHDLLNMLNSRV